MPGEKGSGLGEPCWGGFWFVVGWMRLCARRSVGSSRDDLLPAEVGLCPGTGVEGVLGRGGLVLKRLQL